jgi:outer membrane autotransporter protein
LASGNALQLEQGAALYGPGTVNGDLFNGVNTIYSSSTVYVGGGQYPGTLTINGNYTQDGNSTIDVNLGGATPSTQYDQMKVSGTASLNGALTVNLVNGYSPPKGTQYSILTYALETGDFATKNLDGLTAATPGAKAYILTA